MRSDVPLVISLGFNVILLLALFVSASGSTFGARCGVHYGTGTPEWQECVEGLGDGKRIRLPHRTSTEGRTDE
jgi:hypothetical protein